MRRASILIAALAGVLAATAAFAEVGAAYLAIYPMERQPDGSWKIDGCYLARPDMS